MIIIMWFMIDMLTQQNISFLFIMHSKFLSVIFFHRCLFFGGTFYVEICFKFSGVILLSDIW